MSHTDLPYNAVWPGEQCLEDMWRDTNGIDSTGNMWLTPRMERMAKYTQEQWDAWNKVDVELL
jgi:hypothetical protein